MPDAGGGEGKTEAFYAVMRRISKMDDWLEFARGESYLNLPGPDIDDIQYNHNHSIKEQKYQMLCKWEQRLGRDATVDTLNRLADRLLGVGYGSHPAAQPINQEQQAAAPGNQDGGC